MKSAGSVALRKCKASQNEIAAACSVDRSLVSHWQNGKKKPGPAKRKILNAQFGIKETWWDDPPVEKKATAATVAPKLAGTTHYELLCALRPVLLEALEQLVTKGIDLDDAHDVRAVRMIHTALVDGAKADLAQHRSLVEHPLWPAVRDELLEARFRQKDEAFRSQI